MNHKPKHKPLFKTIMFWVAVLLSPALYVFVAGYPLYLVSKHEKSVYETDMKEYNAAKSVFDSLEQIRFKQANDSLFKAWTSTHDTTLRQVKKISRKVSYSTTGYYKKTDKLKCSREHYDDFICEPIKEWVVTGYYSDGYYMDTTWTDSPYRTRNDWLSDYRYYARNANITQQPYKEYDGHPYQYITKNSKWFGTLFWALGIISLIIFFACGFVLESKHYGPYGIITVALYVWANYIFLTAWKCI